MARLSGEVARLAKLAGYGGKINTGGSFRPPDSGIRSPADGLSHAALGTSNRASFYIKPTIAPIGKEQYDSYAARAKQVGKTMYLMGVDRGYGNRSGMPYRAAICYKDGKEYYAAYIPCDKSGNLTLEAMAARLMDTAEGSRDHHERNMFVDLAVDADTQSRPDDKGGTYAWFLHPNESDVVGIDNIGAKVVELIKGSAGGKTTRTLIITGGSEADRSFIAETIKNNFTNKEKQTLGGVMIVIGNAGSGAAGYFQSNSKHGEIYGVPTIVIGEHYVRESDVTIHEAVHALRAFDKERPEQLKAVENYIGNDADVEESMTEAETVTRQRPLDKHKHTTGYYRYVSSQGDGTRDPDAKDLARSGGNYLVVSDRLQLDDIQEAGKFIEKAKKGKRALRALLNQYPHTHIAHMKNRGTSEAIDTYYKAHAQKGSPLPDVERQVYSPDANAHTAQARDADARSLTAGKVVEYEDGKAVVIQRG